MSAFSRLEARVVAPAVQRLLAIAPPIRPLPRLRSLLWCKGTLPGDLVGEFKASLVGLRYDDDIVRTGGSGPYETHLLQSTHPTTRRARYGLCYGRSRRPFYPTTVKPGTECCRPMPALHYRLMLAMWRATRHKLPARFASIPPDTLHIQSFEMGHRRDKMGYHTDSRPNPKRRDDSDYVIAQEQGSPVLLLNLGSDFMYWTVRIVDGGVIDRRMSLKDQVCIRLRDEELLAWLVEDDHAFKHGVWPPPDVREGMRWSVVCRWSSVRVVEHANEWPYRRVEGSVMEERVVM